MLKRRPFRTLNLIQINKEALIHNVRLYQSLRPDLSICPVLKSNAYGHGLKLIAKTLDPLNLDYFIVDSIYEAYQLRDEKLKTPVLVLGYTHPENFKKKLPFHFTAFDEESLKLHAKLGHPIHIEVDTGMSRMGFPLDELESAMKLAKTINANIVGLFSHLATADEADLRYMQDQESKFENAVSIIKEAGFSPRWIHLGNSAGGIRSKLPSLTMMRLGVSLYGINPIEGNGREKIDELKLVAKVTSSIISVRHLKKGDKVSYGCTYTAPKDMSIAAVPFGYYEGIDRGLSNLGSMEVNGSICPIVGRVCMNHTMINVTDIDVNIGDEVVIYSDIQDSEVSFNEQAKKAGTIPYELMVRLSESVRRA